MDNNVASLFGVPITSRMIALVWVESAVGLIVLLQYMLYQEREIFTVEFFFCPASNSTLFGIFGGATATGGGLGVVNANATDSVFRGNVH